MFGVFGVTGLIKSLAVNSLNLMETGPKFCTAEERAAGPCLTHVRSRPKSIGLGRGPPNCGPTIYETNRAHRSPTGSQPRTHDLGPQRRSHRHGHPRSDSPRTPNPACMAPNDDWGR